MLSMAKLGYELYNGQRSLPFVAKSKLWYGLAAAMMVISIIALSVKGLVLSVEFTGGAEYRIDRPASTDVALGRSTVAQTVDGMNARVTLMEDRLAGTTSVRVQTGEISADQNRELTAALAEAYQVPQNQVSSRIVGGSWGQEVTKQALIALIVFLMLVTVLISAYFSTIKMALAAMVALLHDLLITVGVYSLSGFEVSPATVIGFLTILGYSLYDTVVVFDKVRENTDLIASSNRRTFADAANLAVNQTLVRSINTSVVALLPVASILFIGAFALGAGSLKDIALALFIGIAAGTYSSIFIATPLLVDLRKNEPQLVAQEERVMRRREAEVRSDDEEVVAAVGLREARGNQRSQPKRNKAKRS